MYGVPPCVSAHETKPMIEDSIKPDHFTLELVAIESERVLREQKKHPDTQAATNFSAAIAC